MIEPLDIRSRTELRRWYEQNHTAAKEMMIACGKGRTPRADVISYLDAVEEALCFGWIDSTTRSIDGVFYQRFSPRRKGGSFSALNYARVRRLERLGLMTDAGRAVIPDDIAKRILPKEDIIAALRKDSEVWKNFNSFPELYRTIRLNNIERERKKPEMFNRMLANFIAKTKEGKMYGDWNDGGRLSL